MAYCTAQDVEDAYGTDLIARLTGDASGQTVDTNRVDVVVQTYAGYIDQHVQMQYDLPVDDSNGFLKGLNIEGAFVALQKQSESGADEDLRASERRLDRILQSIANGDTRLEPDGLDTDAMIDAPTRSMTIFRKLRDAANRSDPHGLI